MRVFSSLLLVACLAGVASRADEVSSSGSKLNILFLALDDLRPELGCYGPLPDDLARRLRHGYLACTTFMDHQVGRILDELERLGLRDETVICAWGDHGWKLGEHQGWSKMTNFEIDTQCPLILSHPAMKTTANRTCDAMVEFVDLYPSLVDLAGFDVPPHLAGRSLRPWLNAPDLPGDGVALSQYLRGGMRPESYDGKLYMGYSIRSTEFRYTEWFRWNAERKQPGRLEARELYDHRTDHLENENVAWMPDYSGYVETMAAKLKAKRVAISRKLQPARK